MSTHHAYNARHDAARRKSGVCLTWHDLWPIRPHKCALCGVAFTPEDHRHHRISFDHIVPISQDGPETLENGQLAHRACNARKGIEERKRAA